MASLSSLAIASVCGKSLPRCASINTTISSGRARACHWLARCSPKPGCLVIASCNSPIPAFERRVREHHLRERNRMVRNLTGIRENHHVPQQIEVSLSGCLGRKGRLSLAHSSWAAHPRR